jgi:alpha-beta hydrolase superfamily lysophospholipase
LRKIIAKDATRKTAVLPGYDRTPLFIRRWAPAKEPPPSATVVLAHGYAEHSGRYEALANRLGWRGLALVAYDQRGYGRSGGSPALVRSFDEYVADLHAVVQHARRDPAAHPLFLMGHSMGGAVVLLYVLGHGARPAGLVLSSPLLRLPTPRPIRPAARLIGRLAPALPTLHLERDAVSRDPDVVAAARDDPLCYTGRIRARTGAEMLRATRRLRAEAHRLERPFLLFHGTADRVTDPDGSRALYARAGSTDKTLTLYDGFYHETFNDPGGARVLADVTDWFDDRVGV